MPKPIHINLFIQSRGHHETAWDHPGADPRSLMDISYYVDLAKQAEAAKLDSIFFADVLMMTNDAMESGRFWPDPVIMLAAIAMQTERVGLIATGSCTYSEPYNLARQFASIDHISGGRAAWNIVTTWVEAVAANYGREHTAHGDRYEKGEEFVAAVKDLWDSWADDALVDDRTPDKQAGGVCGDLSRITPIDFKGEYYQVKGPLNVPRSPQGRPVLVQAGASDRGRDFAALHAEAIFTAHLEKETAQEFYRDIKKRAANFGRNADQVVILPGLNPVIGGTEAEAKENLMELNARMDPEVGRRTLSQRFAGHDFSHIDLDQPLKASDFPEPEGLETMKSRAALIVRIVEKEGLTLRELLARFAGGRGHYTTAGTPEQIADLIQDWCDPDSAGSDGGGPAADGFNYMPPVIPALMNPFMDEVVPLLQKRGLFRTEYEGTTLRENLGLDRPASRFFPA
ncbi:MAG: LLM class flavin-dependent oxidoreductase [Alphaproteobacteria bacterium]